MLIVDLGLWLLEKGGEKIFENFTQDDVRNRFNQSLHTASDKLKLKYPDAFGKSINPFLSNESIVNNLIQLLFIDSDVKIENLNEFIDFETLPIDFYQDLINNLKESILYDDVLNNIFSNKQIYQQIKHTNDKFITITQTLLKTEKELNEIKSILTEKFKGKFVYQDFLINYYSSLKNNISDVTFFGLGIGNNYKKPRINLKKIFIRPKFHYKYKGNPLDKHIEKLSNKVVRNQVLDIDIEKLLDIDTNIVILGKAGAGKSLLVKAIVYSILNKDTNLISSNVILNYFPIRVELRNYLTYKQATRRNILGYIKSMLVDEYCITFISETDVEEILQKEPILILFDGLDEVFDITEKNDVRNDIINFTFAYKSKAIITSRKDGYEDAKFNNNYVEIEMQDFDDEQIEDYVEKWYDIEEEDVNTRTREITAFRQDVSQLSSELLRNPLLLSLIVILYRNTLRLPESRLEIYQSCTRTLVDKWDSLKRLEIKVRPDVLEIKDTIFADLAFWQYEVLSESETNLTYATVCNTVAESIKKRLKLDDWAQASNVAQSFMEYAERRSIYFDNNFTHKTFLEYYTAFWIYANCDKKYNVKKRDEIIDLYIGNPFWYIVFELLLNLIDDEQQDEEIMDGIFQRQIDKGWKSFEFLLLALPSIKRISKDQIATLFKSSIIKLNTINNVDYGNISNDLEKVDNQKIFTVFKDLTKHKKYKSILYEVTLNLIKSDIGNKETLFSIFYELLHGNEDNENIFNYFFRECPDFINLIDISSFNYTAYVYSQRKFDNYISFSVKFISQFSVESYFTTLKGMYSTWRFVPLASSFISNVINTRNSYGNTIENFDFYLNQFDSVNVTRSNFINAVRNDSYAFYVFDITDQHFERIIYFTKSTDRYLTKLLLVIIFIKICSYLENNRSYKDQIVNIDSLINEFSDTRLIFLIRDIISKKLFDVDLDTVYNILEIIKECSPLDSSGEEYEAADDNELYSSE